MYTVLYIKQITNKDLLYSTRNYTQYFVITYKFIRVICVYICVCVCVCVCIHISVKRMPAMQETRVESLGWEDPLEKEMATHSSILAWRIPWTEEPSGLQSLESQRIRHDWVATTFTLHFIHICIYIHTHTHTHVTESLWFTLETNTTLY